MKDKTISKFIFEKLTGYFDGASYIQHNPYMGDGLPGLGKAFKEWPSKASSNCNPHGEIFFSNTLIVSDYH